MPTSSCQNICTWLLFVLDVGSACITLNVSIKIFSSGKELIKSFVGHRTPRERLMRDMGAVPGEAKATEGRKGTLPYSWRISNSRSTSLRAISKWSLWCTKEFCLMVIQEVQRLWKKSFGSGLSEQRLCGSPLCEAGDVVNQK